jgi:hypothetical protein
MNRYAYVLNNPTSSVDPGGLMVCQAIPCGSGGQSGGGDDGNGPSYYVDGIEVSGSVASWYLSLGGGQQIQVSIGYSATGTTGYYFQTGVDLINLSVDPFGFFNGLGSSSASPAVAFTDQVVAPSNAQQEAQCLSQYNNSAAGKATQFLSLYNLATNLNSLKTWAEWTALPYLKVQTVNLLSKGAQAIGSTEFLSITSGGATTIMSPTAAGISLSESVGAVAAPIAIGAATVVDAQVHSACASNAPTVELAPTVF